MKKVFQVAVVFILAITSILFRLDTAGAVPAFSRQMKMDCKGCHFQHFPKLNARGRSFKVNGYSETAVETIDGDHHSLSLPINLNMSWISKITYKKDIRRSSPDQKTGTARGQFDVPEEGVFFIGGRVADHIGATVVIKGGEWEDGTIVFGHDFESLHTHAGISVWKGAGPFFGKDIYDTGLLKGSRGWENDSLTQAAGLLYSGGTGMRESEGITVYANHEWFFAALGFVAPGEPGENDFGADVGYTYRFAVTPPRLFKFDTMIGVYGVGGGTSFGGSSSGNDRENFDLEATGMDFQAQGNLTKDITLELIGNFLFNSGDVSMRNAYTKGNLENYENGTGSLLATGQDFRRYQVGFDLGFFHDKLIAKFNYLYSSAKLNAVDRERHEEEAAELGIGAGKNDRKHVDAVSVGLFYNITQNVSLRPEISFVVGGNDEGMRRSGFENDTEGIVNLFYAF